MGRYTSAQKTGTSFILKPGQEKVEVLDSHHSASREQIIASPASRERPHVSSCLDRRDCYSIVYKKNATPNPPMTVENKAPAGATLALSRSFRREVVARSPAKPQSK